MRKIKMCMLFLIILPLLGCECIETHEAMAKQDNFVVTIDAGHGGSGSTYGKRAIDGSFYEWDINNKVAIEVEKSLEEQGITVYRLDDTTGKTDVPLEKRLEKAIDYGSDLHISIHQNSDAKESEATGIEVYYNSSSSNRNINLATDLARRMSDYVGTKNRGWKASDGNLFITREFYRAGIEAVLCEGLFMSNREDIAYMQTDQYAEEYGSAIADSILILYQDEYLE